MFSSAALIIQGYMRKDDVFMYIYGCVWFDL